ncbi:cuticle protein 8-like [Zootermopsis nevadensis]|uniref:Cuticle protein 8 n=1 Tax=Zootermopsis nevadensis TaxID=136037 RepID=A0A067R603_ZOONE|nr:cuticle protein 8-like [Zootermopsis nevadensis]KDR13557.1 Cuticle protein 8 [Zootermopsis nevadensis]
MASKLFLVAALIAAVASASPVTYSVVPVERGVVGPAVTYASSPNYVYTSPIARYSDAVENYASAPVRTIVSPTVIATKTPVVTQAAVDPQYDPNPQYTYSYSINDADTGDSKSHEESRSGDNVQGSYSVVESDGSIRRVDYTADADNGFNAVVHRQTGAAAPPPVPVKSYAPAPAASAIGRIASPAPAPVLALKSIPELAYQTLPAVSYKSAPALALKTFPQVPYQSIPEVRYKSAPGLTLKSSPEVTYQTVPAVRYAVPVPQQLLPSGSLTYLSGSQPVARPSDVRTSFSAPFVNYEY